MKWAQKQTGFTIVELLIVVVVIAILAAITVVAYNGITERARVSSANNDLRLLQEAIMTARIRADKDLMEITGYPCTSCGEQARYDLTLDLIGAAAGADLSKLKVGDPWGNRYLIDENEGEGGGCDSPDFIGIVDAGLHPGIMALTVPYYDCP